MPSHYNHPKRKKFEDLPESTRAELNAGGANMKPGVAVQRPSGPRQTPRKIDPSTGMKDRRSFGEKRLSSGFYGFAQKIYKKARTMLQIPKAAKSKPVNTKFRGVR